MSCEPTSVGAGCRLPAPVARPTNRSTWQPTMIGQATSRPSNDMSTASDFGPVVIQTSFRLIDETSQSQKPLNTPRGANMKWMALSSPRLSKVPTRWGRFHQGHQSTAMIISRSSSRNEGNGRHVQHAEWSRPTSVLSGLMTAVPPRVSLTVRGYDMEHTSQWQWRELPPLQTLPSRNRGPRHQNVVVISGMQLKIA